MTTEYAGLAQRFQPDWRGLVNTILRKGTPSRVFHIELFQDGEIVEALTRRFNLDAGLNPADPDYARRRSIAVQRFCGFDYVRCGLVNLKFPLFKATTSDQGELPRAEGRAFQDEIHGPIMNWADFEKYPWPDPNLPEATAELEWYQRNLPEDMCIIGSGNFAHYAEMLTWLMGYETFCFALYDQRDLVQAIAQKLIDFYRIALRRILAFDRVKIVWGSDDMGHRTGLLFSADDMREFVLAGHREMAAMAHATGRPYLLHACGNLTEIMPDLIDVVKIDAKHSFEDTIEDVREAKKRYGKSIALLGGIDLDFMCRSGPAAIRQRVRETLEVCQPGGGYCLGTGNSVANYIPLDHYLAMIDEGRLFGR